MIKASNHNITRFKGMRNNGVCSINCMISSNPEYSAPAPIQHLAYLIPVKIKSLFNTIIVPIIEAITLNYQCFICM